MKSICLFSSYFVEDSIPYYVKYYLEELCRHFNEVMFITNEKNLDNSEIEFLQSRNIKLKLVVNQGFDFGMWYKAINDMDLKLYGRLALVNDSCILFKSLKNVFNWINSNNFDYCGITSSRRIGYHIQSYFLLFNKRAIIHVADYFKKNGIVTDYQKVIYIYEIGLCTYLNKLGLKPGAVYFSDEPVEVHNPSFNRIEEFIQNDVPLIKKKIVFRAYRWGEYLSLFRMNFDIDERRYINLIKRVNSNQPIIDFNKVCSVTHGKSRIDITLYNIFKSCYRLTKRIPIFTKIFHSLILYRRRLRGDKSKQIVKTSERT